MKELHVCEDRCRTREGTGLSRRRVDEAMDVYPLHYGRVLALRRHRCGAWCTPPDPVTPVRLDWRGPDRYDRTPVRQPCGHVVAPGMVHACGPRPGRPVLFRGSG